MAIINLTPDSFYEKSRVNTEKELIERVEMALLQGAKIIDVGAYSTRPSARPIDEQQELERLINPLKMIRNHFPELIISVDTFRAEVAKQSILEAGVQIINDVSGGTLDSEMFRTVGRYPVAYVLMHMKGTPQTMQNLTQYDDMMAEIMTFFEQRVAQLLQYGVKDIIIDPGFGFAKTLEQNYELLAKMSYFETLNLPILYGISRKSMIYNLLDITPYDALNGTTALNVLGLLQGANILRVHDVKEAMEAVAIVESYNNYLPHRLTNDVI